MRPLIWLVWILLLAPSVAGAHEAAPADTTGPSRLELARRIDLLAHELDDLDLGPVSGRLESRFGLGPAASKIYTADAGVSIGGYGEMLYENFDTQERSDRIDFLRQIFYVGYKFDERFLFNSEIELEHASTSKTGSVSVEFAYVDALLRSEVNLRAGMVLVPMGFVNELHEPPVFLGARRPEVEQRIVPTTWRANGFGVFGTIDPGFSYRFYWVEGLRAVGDPSDGIGGFGPGGLRGGRQNGSQSRIDDAAGVLRVEYSTHGLTLAGSLFHGATAQGDTTAGGLSFAARTTIYEAHVELRKAGLRLRGLVAGARVDEADRIASANGLQDESVGSRLLGGYVEIGYSLSKHTARWTRMDLVPYVRLENTDTQRAMPVGFTSSGEQDRHIVTAGLAFYPHPQVVLKTDYEDRRNAARTETDQWNLALGYLF